MRLRDKIQIINRNKVLDSRGWFLKIISGNEDNLSKQVGEVYLVSAKPGESRANHYHPIAYEWFTVVLGKAQMKIEDVQTKEKFVLDLDSENPQTIYIPNNIAHSFINNFDLPYVLIAYSNMQYDKSDTVDYKL